MLETGIGRAANVALAALPGLHAARRHVGLATATTRRDITEPFVLDDGHLAVPTGPGSASSRCPDALAEFTTSVEEVRRDQGRRRGKGEGGGVTKGGRVPRATYEAELLRLQAELVAMQEWVTGDRQRLVVVFEGRDAAGKGGDDQADHRVPQPARRRASSPCRRRPSASAAQWYFQRYVEQLPAAGEIVLFDRSWYNRAGVERVMGFCTPEEYRRFLHQCPIFERMLVEDGILLRKYWFSVSDEEQERRFQLAARRPDAALEALRRWTSSRATGGRTTRAPRTRCSSTPTSPRRPGTSSRATTSARARLNMIAHLLSTVPYEDVDAGAARAAAAAARRATTSARRASCSTYVPDHAATLALSRSPSGPRGRAAGRTGGLACPRAPSPRSVARHAAAGAAARGPPSR